MFFFALNGYKLTYKVKWLSCEETGIFRVLERKHLPPASPVWGLAPGQEAGNLGRSGVGVGRPRKRVEAARLLAAL